LHRKHNNKDEEIMAAQTSIETTLFFTDYTELRGHRVLLERLGGHAVVGTLRKIPEDADTTRAVPEALTYHIQPNHDASTGLSPVQVILANEVTSLIALDIPEQR
jgi:hypothetical protein